MNTSIIVWGIRILCALAFVLIYRKSKSYENKKSTEREYWNIFSLLVLISIVYISVLINSGEEEEALSAMDALRIIFSSLPGLLLAFGVFFFMRMNHNNVYKEGYFKGKSDGEALLEEQPNNYKVSPMQNKDRITIAYEKGLIDGYQFIFEMAGIPVPGEDTVDKLLRNNHVSVYEVMKLANDKDYVDKLHTRYKQYQEEAYRKAERDLELFNTANGN